MKCQDCPVWQRRRAELVDIDLNLIPDTARFAGKDLSEALEKATYETIIGIKQEVRRLDIVETCCNRNLGRCFML